MGRTTFLGLGSGVGTSTRVGLVYRDGVISEGPTELGNTSFSRLVREALSSCFFLHGQGRAILCTHLHPDNGLFHVFFRWFLAMNGVHV